MVFQNGWDQFSNNQHRLMAQSYAYGRQDAPDTAGIAIFDLDDNTSVVASFYKMDVMAAYNDHTEYEEKVDVRYAVFRRDRFWGNGFSGQVIEYSEDEFFGMGKDVFCKAVIYMPIPGGEAVEKEG